MTVFTHLLQQSGIDPYHENYNPDALKDFTYDGDKRQDSKYCILSLEPITIADAQYYTKQVNDAYREHTGEDEDWTGLTGFLEEYVNSMGCDFEEIRDRMISDATEMHDARLKREKEGDDT